MISQLPLNFKDLKEETIGLANQSTFLFKPKTCTKTYRYATVHKSKSEHSTHNILSKLNKRYVSIIK
jgi:hypothetical protein